MSSEEKWEWFGHNSGARRAEMTKEEHAEWVREYVRRIRRHSEKLSANGKLDQADTLSLEEVGGLKPVERLTARNKQALFVLGDYYRKNAKADVTPGLMMLVAILSDDERYGYRCTLSVGRTAEFFGRSERAIRDARQKLRAQGLIRSKMLDAFTCAVEPVLLRALADEAIPAIWVIDAVAPAKDTPNHRPGRHEKRHGKPAWDQEAPEALPQGVVSEPPEVGPQGDTEPTEAAPQGDTETPGSPASPNNAEEDAQEEEGDFAVPGDVLNPSDDRRNVPMDLDGAEPHLALSPSSTTGHQDGAPLADSSEGSEVEPIHPHSPRLPSGVEQRAEHSTGASLAVRDVTIDPYAIECYRAWFASKPDHKARGIQLVAEDHHIADANFRSLVASLVRGKHDPDDIEEAIGSAISVTAEKVAAGDLKGSPARYFQKVLRERVKEIPLERLEQQANARAKLAAIEANLQAQIETQAAVILAQGEAEIAKAKSDKVIAEKRPELFDRAVEQRAAQKEKIADAKAQRVAAGPRPSQASRLIVGQDGRQRWEMDAHAITLGFVKIDGRNANKVLDAHPGATTVDVLDALEAVHAQGGASTSESAGKDFKTGRTIHKDVPASVLSIIKKASAHLRKTVAHRLHGKPVDRCTKVAVIGSDLRPITADWFAVSEEFVDRVMSELPGLAESDPKGDRPGRKITAIGPHGSTFRVQSRDDLSGRDRVLAVLDGTIFNLSEQNDASEAVPHISLRYGEDGYWSKFEEAVIASLQEANEAGLKRKAEREAQEAAWAEEERRREHRKAREAEFAATFGEASVKLGFSGSAIVDAFGRVMLVNPETKCFHFEEDVARYGDADADLVKLAQRVFEQTVPRYGAASLWDSLSDGEVRELIEKQRSVTSTASDGSADATWAPGSFGVHPFRNPF